MLMVFDVALGKLLVRLKLSSKEVDVLVMLPFWSRYWMFSSKPSSLQAMVTAVGPPDVLPSLNRNALMLRLEPLMAFTLYSRYFPVEEKAAVFQVAL
jgi:hypothetical protein